MSTNTSMYTNSDTNIVHYTTLLQVRGVSHAQGSRKVKSVKSGLHPN